MTLSDGFAEYAATRYVETAAEVSARLRRLADEIDHEVPRKNFQRGDDERPDYLQHAQRVVHIVTWGVANLSMDGLISLAADVHSARDLELTDG